MNAQLRSACAQHIIINDSSSSNSNSIGVARAQYIIILPSEEGLETVEL